jgi:hypothetical protein
MLQKLVGKTHELSVIHSQADEYLSVVSQFGTFTESVHVELLGEIMRDVFSVFRPGGFTLSEEELGEVMEGFYDWVLVNNLDGALVPFPVFQTWFVHLAERIVRAKHMSSDFRIEEGGSKAFSAKSHSTQNNQSCETQ